MAARPVVREKCGDYCCMAARPAVRVECGDYCCMVARPVQAGTTVAWQLGL